MANPVSKPSKNGWLRNILVGKKKTNRTTKKRGLLTCCAHAEETKQDQTVQTNINSDNNEEGRLPIINVNAYGDPKKNNRACPGKIFPLERRGCGFHLYFCIDNAGKNIVRNNKTKNMVNERNKVENCLEDDKEFMPNICESESFVGTVKSRPESTQRKSEKYTKNTSHMTLNSRGRGVSPHEKLSPLNIHPSGGPDKRSKESIRSSKHLISSPRHQEEKGGNSILRGKRTSLQAMLVDTILQDTFPETSTLKDTKPWSPVNSTIKNNHNSFLPTPRSFPERQLFPSATENTLLKNFNSYINEQAIFEDEPIWDGKLQRKSTVKDGTYARNSLLSLRKKKQSFVGGSMIPEILSKLENIEDKLSELEKVYEDRGKRQGDITNIVGISCNSAKSSLSTDLKNLNKHGESIKRNNEISNSRRSSYRVQPVLIKSFGEEIVVNTPDNVSVVKNTRSKQESKQLVYHNTQELDAHNIASKSFSRTTAVKSQTPKLGARNGEKYKENTNKKDPEMWSRISEELKL